MQNKGRRTRKIEDLDEEEYVLDGIIPTVSAEKAPNFTDAKQISTHPPFLHSAVIWGPSNTPVNDAVTTTHAEDEVDEYLRNTSDNPAEISAQRGTFDGDSEEEVETVPPNEAPARTRFLSRLHH